MTSELVVDDAALEFFNGLAGTLRVELNESPQQIGGLLNLIAPPSARIVSVSFDVHVFDPESEEGRPLTDAELDTVVFTGSALDLRGEGDVTVTHHAPNGYTFRIRDLIAAIEISERASRDSGDWLGGVDVHHIYFEGMDRSPNGVWNVYWGS
ncbi:MAG: hypothetical protein IT186_02055 [Acidobacteria bacterium]|nr:hypothetical protein [Acidobacteriota bacterium]